MILTDESSRSLLDAEVRADGLLLVEVINLLERKIPLVEWPLEAMAGLSLAMNVRTEDPREREKALRLQRHLFAGEPPRFPSRRRGGASPRRAERLRADLADLVAYGSGLHLVAGQP